jgi:hypothetical protein
MRKAQAMMQGLSVTAIASLINHTQLYQSLYILNLPTHSVYHPSVQEVPWTVAVILGAHSTKHVFHRGTLPAPDKIGSVINSVCNQIHWRAVLGNPSWLWWRCRRKGTYTKQCDKVIPPQVAALTKELKTSLFGTWHRVLASASRHRMWANYPVALKHCEKWLRQQGKVAIPTDKDGGYCLMTRSEYRVLRDEKIVIVHGSDTRVSGCTSPNEVFRSSN